MAVLAAKRKESRFEAIVYSEEIHRSLTELLGRSFGIKNMDAVVRRRYVAGKCEKDAYWESWYLLHNAKMRVDNLAAEMTGFLRAANTLYPTTMAEYTRRRENQDYAICICEQIMKELQHVADIFDVDINMYKQPIRELEREIMLIKKWRQSDNRFRTILQGSD